MRGWVRVGYETIPKGGGCGGSWHIYKHSLLTSSPFQPHSGPQLTTQRMPQRKLHCCRSSKQALGKNMNSMPTIQRSPVFWFSDGKCCSTDGRHSISRSSLTPCFSLRDHERLLRNPSGRRCRRNSGRMPLFFVLMIPQKMSRTYVDFYSEYMSE